MSANISIRRGDWTPALRPLPVGEAFAAIGDVHGQDDLFAALIRGVWPDLQGASERTIVQLGDMVDRGPAALSALRRAQTGLPDARFVALMGNHEDKMLGAILTEDPDVKRQWLAFGGAETLREAGVDPDDADWRERFARALGPHLLDWVSDLPQLHRIGDYVFVHAGLDPAAPLDRQDRHTLMWTRRPWLTSDGPYAGNVAVMHGHTPQPEVDLSHAHRVNLDTGAFRTGVLSALVVAGDRMRVVQAVRSMP